MFSMANPFRVGMTLLYERERKTLTMTLTLKKFRARLKLFEKVDEHAGATEANGACKLYITVRR